MCPSQNWDSVLSQRYGGSAGFWEATSSSCHSIAVPSLINGATFLTELKLSPLISHVTLYLTQTDLVFFACKMRGVDPETEIAIRSQREKLSGTATTW